MQLIGAIAGVGYLAAMAWAIQFAPDAAKLPALAILHGAFFLGFLCGHRCDLH